jgi:hypothetical protein
MGLSYRFNARRVRLLGWFLASFIAIFAFPVLLVSLKPCPSALYVEAARAERTFEQVVSIGRIAAANVAPQAPNRHQLVARFSKVVDS